ncbi:uncharacterized membrane protein (DUF485 family) [Lipingzhangella halophila]|uniref:Uncharacterized membrane protein (DUF485 family) n=1 Tax=Lipingzhangella halophila TaxID=1783352 RepID=A0A7W7RI37_9ACTN|nr:DUF485 domain-containing protein [Lipingzhangella halophila]MBB4932424.1 uncharacterized membrane protein (DUF485 family) [Lipingzhangella halophila]
MVEYLEGAVRATADEHDVRPIRGAHRRPPAQRRLSFVLLASDSHFLKLRKRFVVATVLVVAVSLGWYLAYLFLSVYARDLMATPIYGAINVALVMGIGQFVSTFVLAWGYCRYAARRIDPHIAMMRDEDGDAQVIRNGRVVRG